jgi:Tfp pilus assembly pilus retraction ATPase PilT
MIISNILKKAIELGASDIIISPGNYPAVKKSGEIMYLEESGKIDGEALKQEIFSIIPEKMKESFISEMEIDFSIQAE